MPLHGYVVSLDVDGTGLLAGRRNPGQTHKFSLGQVVGGELDFSFEGPGIPILYQLNEAGRVHRVVPVDAHRDPVLTAA